MSRNITDNQRKVLALVADFMDENSFPPTIRDIAAMYNCSVKGAYDHILALEKKGYLERNKQRSRGIILTLKANSELSRGDEGVIPLYGNIAAGPAIFADDNIEGAINYPGTLPDSGEYFALQVKGDSMTGIGIFEFDTVIIRRQDKVATGEIAACLIGEEAALKQVLYKRDRVILRSFNPKYPDKELKGVKVLGKLYGLFRQY